MTDPATPWQSSLTAQDIAQDIVDEANKELLRHINDLFNSPADKDAFTLVFRSCARITASLGMLNQLVRHDFD